jgi:alkylation response protein AidB-like acyl-CoA dehydrogenase
VISFEMSEEQELIRDTLQEFANEEMRSIGRDCDESFEIPQAFLDTVWELGLTATQIPEEFGGGGEERSPVTNAIILEELGFGDVALAIAATAPNAFVNAVLDYGTDGQKKILLPLFCGDKFHVASLAALEHGPLADPAAPLTKAEPKGDGFVLSGKKSWVVLGDRASHFLVTARNNGGVDAFIVSREVEGLTIGEAEKNVGLRGLTTVSIELERVEVGAESKLGGENGSNVAAILNGSRAAHAAILVGASRGVLETCVPYTKDRIAFDEPIAKKQSIAFRLAEMHMEVEAMRWMCWKTASHVAQGHAEATKQAHLTRQYVAEKSMWIADNGIQVFGGHGYIREYPVEMWFRNVRTLSVLEGLAAV